MKLVEGYKEGYCAICGAEVKDYEEPVFERDGVYFGFTCEKCGYSGEEYCKLVYECTNGWIPID